MLSAIRKRVTYANVAVTFALVFVMSGGAYAASRYVITSTKQISPKVLKSLKGARGAAGSPGAVGPQGPAGPTGPAGKNGADGTNGANGADGQSVTSASLGVGNPTCKSGGAEFKSASGTTFACNGEAAAQGGGGLPATLPKGGTLKGVYNAEGFAPAPFKGVGDSVTFQVPLEKAPAVVHYIKPGETTLPSGCQGSIENPEAEPGVLCVFAKTEEDVSPLLGVGICNVEINECAPLQASTLGFGVAAPAEKEGTVSIGGTWAVTEE